MKSLNLFLVMLFAGIFGLHSSRANADTKVLQKNLGGLNTSMGNLKTKLSAFSKKLSALKNKLTTDTFDLFDRYLQAKELTEHRFFNKEGGMNAYTIASFILKEDLLLLIQKFIDTYPQEVKDLAKKGDKTRYIQKVLVPPTSRIIFFGDLHGDIQAFVRMLCNLMNQEELDSSLKIKKANTYIVFLGDIVDYGFYGADTLTTVMKLKITNPNNVLICRGNHETDICYGFGFYDEIGYRYFNFADPVNYKEEDHDHFFKTIYDSFNYLPAAIFIGIQGQPSAQFIQCCHGGLDQQARNNITTLLKGNNTVQELDGKQPGWNLQWCDFTGKGNDISDSPGRGDLYPIQPARDEMKTIDVKYIFRGHQDNRYAHKHIVETFEDPINFFPVDNDKEFNEIKLFKNGDTSDPEYHLSKNRYDWFKDLQHNYKKESLWWHYTFQLGTLPQEIGPIFTFTNASLVRQNYDEGFGLLEVKDSWEKSILKNFTHRPPAFRNNSQNKNLCNKKIHFTVIDKDGNPTISTDQTEKGISHEFITKIKTMIK